MKLSPIKTEKISMVLCTCRMWSQFSRDGPLYLLQKQKKERKIPMRTIKRCVEDVTKNTLRPEIRSRFETPTNAVCDEEISPYSRAFARVQRPFHQAHKANHQFCAYKDSLKFSVSTTDTCFSVLPSCCHSSMARSPSPVGAVCLDMACLSSDGW